ncbi:MAG TPA: hypothetical protein VIL83_04135 [Capillibacterium sp.]
MKTNPFFAFPFPVRGFVQGYLEERKAGEMVLTTRHGVFPVRLEGEMVPLGEDLVFRVLREEPGRLVLIPYRMETLPEALPFWRDLFAGEEETGNKLLLAAVQENLPLTREVLAGLKKALITAEREWGVRVHPQALAFLQARGIPCTPRTLLWALYTLFPGAQRIMWQKAGAKLLPDPVASAEKAGETPHSGEGNGEKGETAVRKEGLVDILREAAVFLQQQAERDSTLPHFLFYLFPALAGEARWVGRKFPAPAKTNAEVETKEEKAGFGFYLEYQSTFFGRLRICGIGDQEGIRLTVGAAPAVLDQNLLNGLGPYLRQKGWPVRSVEFQADQGKKGEDSFPPLYPLRIDGWM